MIISYITSEYDNIYSYIYIYTPAASLEHKRTLHKTKTILNIVLMWLLTHVTTHTASPFILLHLQPPHPYSYTSSLVRFLIHITTPTASSLILLHLQPPHPYYYTCSHAGARRNTVLMHCGPAAGRLSVMTYDMSCLVSGVWYLMSHVSRILF
jgi:hypothetical protein